MKTWIAMALCLLLSAPAWSAPPPLDVVVEGVEGAARESVLARLTLARNRENPRLTAARVRLWFKRADEEIRAALAPLGYYHPTLASRLDGTDFPFRALFRVDPGPRTRWGGIRVEITGEAAQDPAFEAWRQQLLLVPGAPFLHEAYEAAKKELLRLAAERGYAEGRLLEHRVEVDPEQRLAHLDLRYDSGPRLRLGEVTFSQEPLDPALLRRYIPFRPGDPYDSRALLQLQQGLSAAGYFRVVEVVPGKAEGGVTPVKVTLEPLPANEYTVGAGYGTDTGPRATLGWERRWLNRQGHQAEVTGKLSAISQEVTARYGIPWDDPARERLDLTMDLEREFATDSADSTALSWTGSLLRHRGAWQETLSLEYQLEAFVIGGTSGHSELLMPGVAWLLSEGDHPLRPRRGFRLSATTRGAVESLLSDATFLQGWSQGKVIRPLGEEGRLLLSGEGGATATSDFDNLPTSVRFFAGGSNRVRGYDYNSLGPRDGEGEVVGGQYLLAGSLEYEHTVRGPWSGAVFLDVGNAFNGLGEPFHAGAGVGVRWQSPLGPVRVDLAYPLDGEEDSLLPRLHLNFGPEL